MRHASPMTIQQYGSDHRQFTDMVTASIDKAIALKSQQIATLKEYKTTLIDAAVTGKIKVV